MAYIHPNSIHLDDRSAGDAYRLAVGSPDAPDLLPVTNTNALREGARIPLVHNDRVVGAITVSEWFEIEGKSGTAVAGAVEWFVEPPANVEKDTAAA